MINTTNPSRYISVEAIDAIRLVADCDDLAKPVHVVDGDYGPHEFPLRVVVGFEWVKENLADHVDFGELFCILADRQQ